MPIPPYVVLERGCSRQQLDEAVRELGLPVVVKPENEGSSIGLTIVREASRLSRALEEGWRYDRRCLAEKIYFRGSK